MTTDYSVNVVSPVSLTPDNGTSWLLMLGALALTGYQQALADSDIVLELPRIKINGVVQDVDMEQLAWDMGAAARTTGQPAAHGADDLARHAYEAFASERTRISTLCNIAFAPWEQLNAEHQQVWHQVVKTVQGVTA